MLVFVEYLTYFFVTFFSSILLGKPIIYCLKLIKSKQFFRPLGPKSHTTNKQNTPTMGAWIFLIPVFCVLSFFYQQSEDINVLIIISALLAGTLLGAADDLLKIFRSNYKGVNSQTKLLIQFFISSLMVYFTGSAGSDGLNYFEYIWAFLVIAGTANAVNLTDGLDGLASGVSVISFLSLGLFLCFLGNTNSLIISLIICGGLLAFLFFNKKPAKVFMGDTGSLALGMGLGTLAYINDAEWYLLVFAFVPLLEAFSVIVQVASAKLSRKFLGRDIRPFKMAPLHHHFELCGVKEEIVVLIFWVLQLICPVTFGLVTLINF